MAADPINARPLDHQALDVFEASCDWPETGAAFDARLQAECGTHLQLLARVRALLARDRDATRAMPTEPPEASELRSRPPPQRIARWRLGELLGVGGMGAVYRGERADGVFAQTVAIKLVRPGLLRASAEARFADERRMLARLHHPHIAQLYDGGTDPSSGYAWLAMEYVDGTPITEFVQQAQAPVAQRLALFAAVCDAVQCAHQNLIVHADIKPSNILVTHQGQVKLLDFGISQWVESDAGAADAPVAAPITHAYAAPERLAGGAATVAGDVYSLGLLLAELLGPAAAEPDLAAILAKAGAADPDQRYQTVQALAADIRRHVQHFPVHARQRTLAYVFMRFVRRNRVGVALAAVAGCGLLVAALGMSLLYVRAEHARARADQRFNEMRQLSRFMIFDLYDEFARVPGTTLGRLALVNKAGSYLDRLSTEDGAPLELKLEALSGKTRLGTVLGVQGIPNLGRVADATRTLDAAIQGLQVLHVQAPQRVDVRAELASALVQRATIEIWNEHRPELGRPMLARARELLGKDTSPRSLEVRQDLYLRTADLADWTQDVPGLTSAAKAGLAELSLWPEAMRQSASFATQQGRMLAKLGDGLYYAGDLRGALVQYQEAAKVLRDADARWPDRGAILNARQLAAWSIATTLSNLNGNREALPEFEVALSVLDRLQQLEKNDVTLLYHAFTVRSSHAEALSMLGQHAEAEQRFRALIAERQARMDAAPDDPSAARGVAYEWFMLALAQERNGRRMDACRSFVESARRFSALDGRGSLTAWDRTDHLRVALQRAAACH